MTLGREMAMVSCFAFRHWFRGNIDYFPEETSLFLEIFLLESHFSCLEKIITNFLL